MDDVMYQISYGLKDPDGIVHQCYFELDEASTDFLVNNLTRAPKGQVIDLAIALVADGGIAKDSSVPEPPRASDGHYHLINGEPDLHTWAECPDNPESEKKPE